MVVLRCCSGIIWCVPVLIQCVTLTKAVTLRIWFNPIRPLCSLTRTDSDCHPDRHFTSVASRVNAKGFKVAARGKTCLC